MIGIVDLAHERMRRSPAAGMTYAMVLQAISEVFQQHYWDREAEIEAFGEQLTVKIDLHVGSIRISPEPKARDG